jgi:hypothetical protein
VWRKESSKSASYFILHFFHGYGRREIAELTQLPIAAIYNKLKTARSEVRSYLEEPGRLRIVNRDTPPKPTLSWNLLSSQDLFRELRQTILDARITDCLAEGALLAQYRSATPRPGKYLLPHLAFPVIFSRSVPNVSPGFLNDRYALPDGAACVSSSLLFEPSRSWVPSPRRSSACDSRLFDFYAKVTAKADGGSCERGDWGAGIGLTGNGRFAKPESRLGIILYEDLPTAGSSRGRRGGDALRKG